MLLRRKPILCNYYLTYRCNAACGFCDIWERPSPYVTLKEVKENLRDLKRLGIKVIDFTGGEPLLHRELSLFLSEAKALGFITTLTTNCLLYPKHAEKLRGLVDMLHFSLDSPIAEEHNKSRGVELFGHFMRSLDIAGELGERPDVLFTVQEGNIHQIRQVYEEITQPRGLMLLLNPIFEYNGLGSKLSEENLRELSDWGKKKGVYLNEAFISLRKNGGNKTAAPLCRAGTTTVVISPENKMLLPCYHLEKEAMPIDGELYKLRTSEPVKAAIKMEGKYAECEGCTVNCYFQPSFAVETSKYFFQALPSTLKYSLAKGTWKRLLPAALQRG